VIEDPDRCYQAARSKDARFDGWFFCAVTSTGIYCRPSCPARTPKRENIRFYPTAAAAQQAGFRACLRCRPDATPGSPEWNVRGDVVARAMRLIRDGVVDREGVDGLAHRLAYSTRQLNRLMTAELGAGPLAIARGQRSQTARVLLETTDLPVAHVAFAAGFSSVRQFNETVRQIFADTPRGLRARAAHGKVRRSPADGKGGATQIVRLRLPCRRPFDPSSALTFLGLRAVPGVEFFDGSSYMRALRLPHGHALVTLRAPDAAPAGPARHGDEPAYVEGELRLSDLRDLGTAVARCRQLLDLDADPVAVADALGADPHLGPIVRSDPGRRVPGAVDGFELAVRAVIGQQVSVAGARTVAAKLVEVAGDPVADSEEPVTSLFPAPAVLAELARREPGAFAMPAGRRRALGALADAVQAGALVIDPGADPAELRRTLVALPGIGPWTAEYVAMRALRDPDAFMPTDLGIRRGALVLGLPDEPAALRAAGEAWRPWRSYAMAHLWSLPATATPSLPTRSQKGRAA
jgi:AraC family transcriptional regulator, regulatory protein of adaptative response / DNA-3-methyladenine glycosylase II